MHEVEVERGREVQRVDPLARDQLQGLAGVPGRLGHVAASDERGRQQRVDAHRVVERHDAERAMTGLKPVLEHLRDRAGPLGAMRSRDPLRPPGRAGRVELDGGLPLVEGECAGVFLVRNELTHVMRLPDHDHGSTIVDAVVEIAGRDAIGERDDDGTEPLAAPVELHRLGLVREHAGDAIAGPHAPRRESTRDPGRMLTQLRIGQPHVLTDECLCAGLSLDRVQEARREVHAPATSAIASTMDV